MMQAVRALSDLFRPSADYLSRLSELAIAASHRAQPGGSTVSVRPDGCEVLAFFDHVPSLKYRTALMVCYGAGLQHQRSRGAQSHPLL